MMHTPTNELRVARTPSRYVRDGRKSVVLWLKQPQGHNNASVPLEPVPRPWAYTRKTPEHLSITVCISR